MGENTKVMSIDNIRKRVFIIRGQQVMLDSDLAEIYGYEVKRLNEQVKRNIARFPEDFMFELTDEEAEEVSRSQIATLNNLIHLPIHYQRLPNLRSQIVTSSSWLLLYLV